MPDSSHVGASWIIPANQLIFLCDVSVRECDEVALSVRLWLQGCIAFDLDGIRLDADRALVRLVYLLDLVCLVFWLNETNRMDQRNQMNQID